MFLAATLCFYPPAPACKGERALRRTSMGKLYRNVCGGINRPFHGVWAWGCHDLRPKPRFCRPPKPHSAFFTCKAAKTSPKLCFELRRYVFIVVLNVTFWHRGWEKCVAKMDLLNQPGHAVSLLRNRHFWLVLGVVGVSIGFSMVSGREAATIWGQNHDFAGYPNLILPFSRVRLLKPHRNCVF